VSSKKEKLDALVVVAHPDDEALFFSGLILSKKRNWHVICVTDGNADKHGPSRQLQFQKSCHLLGVKKSECWGYPDIYRHRLNTEELHTELLTLPKYRAVFTHGIIGEYGHPHHQDVSYAVHKAFEGRAPVYSAAYNCFPEMSVRLAPNEFKIKTEILWNIYSQEIRRFLNFLPATSFEGFAKVSLKEVETLYQWLRYKRPFNPKILKTYHWLRTYLKSGGGNLSIRPF